MQNEKCKVQNCPPTIYLTQMSTDKKITISKRESRAMQNEKCKMKSEKYPPLPFLDRRLTHMSADKD
jgi:hypothetical protein